MSNPRPLTKWVGGKTNAAPAIIEAIEEIDGFGGEDTPYCEPFAGGGGLFVAAMNRGMLDGKEVVLGDANVPLMVAWGAVSTTQGAHHVADLMLGIERDYAALPQEVTKGSKRRAFYNSQRQRLNSGDGLHTEQAARLLWLVQHGFNGLYRESKSGNMNTPWNKDQCSDTAVDSAADNLVLLAETIRDRGIRLTAHAGDYYPCVHRVRGARAIIYADPPYLKTDFVQYQADGFTPLNHAQLQALGHVVEVTHGHRMWVSNMDSPSARQLYAPNYIVDIEDKVSVNRDPAGRGVRRDILVRIGGW